MHFKKFYAKYTMILTFLLIFLFFIGQTHADPTVMVTDYHLDPETLLPGDDAELTITLTNTETTATKTDTDYINGLPVDQTTDTIAATIDKVWITSDGDGINSISSAKTFTNIGDLSPGSCITLSFKLSADENITEGLYHPVIRVDVDDYQDVKYPLPVRITNLSATLLPKEVPKKISSSGSTTITLTAVNNRQTPVEDVTITAPYDQNITVSPVSTYIGTLASEASTDITCSLHPSTLGVQNLTFTISFRNGENSHETMISTPIEVIETHDVSPVLYTIPDTLKQHGSDRITLEVYNAKSDTITGVTVIPVTDLKTSPSEYFIGSMDADDVFSASFDVYSQDLDPGNYNIGFKVAFKQGNNFFESPTLSDQIEVIPNTSSNESGDFGLMIGILSLLIVVIIIVVFLIRKRRIMK